MLAQRLNKSEKEEKKNVVPLHTHHMCQYLVYKKTFRINHKTEKDSDVIACFSIGYLLLARVNHN